VSLFAQELKDPLPGVLQALGEVVDSNQAIGSTSFNDAPRPRTVAFVRGRDELESSYGAASDRYV
jgi:hypothetical protein